MIRVGVRGRVSVRSWMPILHFSMMVGAIFSTHVLVWVYVVSLNLLQIFWITLDNMRRSGLGLELWLGLWLRLDYV